MESRYMQKSTNQLKADVLNLTDSSRRDASNEEGKLPACTQLASAPGMFTANPADFKDLTDW